MIITWLLAATVLPMLGTGQRSADGERNEERSVSDLLRAFIRDEASLRLYLSRFLSRREDIEEVLQEAFLQAFAAETQTRIRAPSAYLRRVSRNLALSLLKKKSFADTPYLEDLPDSEVLHRQTGRELADSVSAGQALLIVGQAIAALPEMRRRAVILRRVEGCSMKEVAERLGITVSTAEKHVATGMAQCIDILERQGHDVTELAAPLAEGPGSLRPHGTSRRPASG